MLLPDVSSWEGICKCARLGSDFLESKGLDEYIEAAFAGIAEDPSETFVTIQEFIELQIREMMTICVSSPLFLRHRGREKRSLLPRQVWTPT